MFDNKVSIEYMAVSMPINEDFYEQVIIEHLRDDLGYEFLYGPDVPRAAPDYRDVFLSAVLPNSLRRINPGLPAAAIEQAILKISNIDAGSLYQKNEVFNDYLQSGVEVRYFDGKEERDDIVYLLVFRDGAHIALCELTRPDRTPHC